MTATPETIDRDAFPQSSAPPAAPAANPPAAPPIPKHGQRMRAAALAAGISEGEMDSLSPDQLFQEIRVVQAAGNAQRRPEPTPPPAAPVVPVEDGLDWGEDPTTKQKFTEADYTPALREVKKVKGLEKQVEEMKAELAAVKQREQQRARREEGSTVQKILAEFPIFGKPEERTPGSPQMAYAKLLGEMMHSIPDAERTTLEADLRKKIALLPGVSKAAPKPAAKPVIESALASPEERTAMLTALKPRNESGQFTSAELAESAVEAPTDRTIVDAPQVGREAAKKAVAQKLRRRGHYVPVESPNGASDLGIPE